MSGKNVEKLAQNLTKNTKEFLKQVNIDIQNSPPGYNNAKAMFRQNIVEDLEEGDDDVALQKYVKFMQNPRQYLMNMEEKHKSNKLASNNEDKRIRNMKIAKQMNRDPYSLLVLQANSKYVGGRRKTKRSKKTKKSNRRTRRQ